MLRKVGRIRARVPLTREGVNSALLHADGWVGVDEVRGLRYILLSSAIGYFSVGAAYRHPKSVLPLPMYPSWLISGARCIEPSLPRIYYKKVPPPQT